MPRKRRSPLEPRQELARGAPVAEVDAAAGKAEDTNGSGRNSSGKRPAGGGELAEAAVTRPAALEDLAAYYRTSYGYLHRQAMRMSRSSDVAHDVVHEAFTVTAEKIKAGVEIEHLGAWLSTVIRNRCTHLWRSPALVPIEEHELDPVHEDAPAEIAAARDECRDVYRSVAELSPSQRAAFLMAEVRGMTYDEIAESMGRSYNSVRQLLARARRQVRETVKTQLCLSLSATFVHDRLTAFLRHPAELAYQPAAAVVATTVAVAAAGGFGSNVPKASERASESAALPSLAVNHAVGRGLAAGSHERDMLPGGRKRGTTRGTATARRTAAAGPQGAVLAVGDRPSTQGTTAPAGSGGHEWDKGAKLENEQDDLAQAASENSDGVPTSSFTTPRPGAHYGGGPSASYSSGAGLPDLKPRSLTSGLKEGIDLSALLEEDGDTPSSGEAESGQETVSAGGQEGGAGTDGANDEEGGTGTDAGTDPDSDDKPPPGSEPPPPPSPCRTIPVNRSRATRRC